MSKFKNKQANAASQIFEEHPNIDFIYITSDGNGFTKDQKHNADEHARVLHDKSVTPFERGFEDTFVDDQDEDEKSAKAKADDSGEREELAKKYEELFKKKPNHMTGIEKLRSQIAEKEAELAKTAKTPEDVNKPEGEKEGAE